MLRTAAFARRLGRDVIRTNFYHTYPVRLLAQAVSLQPLTTEAPVQSKNRVREICGRQNGKVTGFSPSRSVLLCQHHSTNTLFIYHRRNTV